LPIDERNGVRVGMAGTPAVVPETVGGYEICPRVVRAKDNLSDEKRKMIGEKICRENRKMRETSIERVKIS